MRDPDTGLYMDFLPLYARVPMSRLAEAYEWAMTSEHPECRYAIWAIARNHALSPAADSRRQHPGRVRNFRHLSMVLRVYEECGDGTGDARPDPDLSRFHCPRTKAGAASAHPEAQMLSYRVLSYRARRKHASCEREAQNLSNGAFYCIQRLGRILKQRFTDYPVPQLRDLFIAEEIVCREALRWASAQPRWSAAFRLFDKLRERTNKLEADNKAGTPQGSTTEQKVYANYILICRKIGRLYLNSQCGGALL
jgi:hypothetical protein